MTTYDPYATTDEWGRPTTCNWCGENFPSWEERERHLNGSHPLAGKETRSTSKLSLVFGTAEEVDADDPITEHQSVRVYRAAGRTFIGHDTLEINHVCGTSCANRLIKDEGVEYVGGTCEDYRGTGLAYVRLEREPFYYPTIDVIDFDPGDDPYVVCQVCETELHRDDEKFLAEYGHPIRGTTEHANDNQLTLPD